MAPHAVETSYEGQVANEWQIPISHKIKSLLLDQSCHTFSIIHFHPPWNWHLRCLSKTVRTCWTFFQASHPDFMDTLLPKAEVDLLTYGSRVAINWGSNNYPMGHHMGASLATGHISLKTVDCSHSNSIQGKRQMNKYLYREQVCLCNHPCPWHYLYSKRAINCWRKNCSK